MGPEILTKGELMYILIGLTLALGFGISIGFFLWRYLDLNKRPMRNLNDRLATRKDIDPAHKYTISGVMTDWTVAINPNDVRPHFVVMKDVTSHPLARIYKLSFRQELDGKYAPVIEKAMEKKWQWRFG